MISPLPRNKRGKNPKPSDGAASDPATPDQADEPVHAQSSAKPAPNPASKPDPSEFNNTPFAKLDLEARPGEESEQSTGS